jgi:hypothetical protein
MDARQTLIQVLFPLLYDIKPKMPRSKARSSYGMKHDFEHALGFYIANSETIPALVALGVPHFPGDPNYGFKVKEKFPMDWIRNSPPLTRPKYESKTEWEAYLHARSTIDALVEELVAGDTSSDSRFKKLGRVLGYHREAKSEVPASLTARLTAAPLCA